MIEGKIANQTTFNRVNGNICCAKCMKIIDKPETTFIPTKSHTHLVSSYIGTPHFIYESKSGMAVTYCSKYCASKHNHRFTKKGK